MVRFGPMMWHGEVWSYDVAWWGLVDSAAGVGMVAGSSDVTDLFTPIYHTGTRSSGVGSFLGKSKFKC